MEYGMHGFAATAFSPSYGTALPIQPDKRRNCLRINARRNFETLLLQAFDDIDER
jgi:hypothetical protein